VFNAGQHTQVSGLAVAPDGTIYTVVTLSSLNGTELVNEDFLCALSPNGTLKWKSNASIDLFIQSYSLTIGQDGTIYSVKEVVVRSPPDPISGHRYENHTFAIMALNPDDGSVKWEYHPPNLPDNMALSNLLIGPNDELFFSASNQICALDQFGQSLWNLTFPYHSSFVLAQNSSIVVTADGHLLFILPNGTISGNVTITDGTSLLSGQPMIRNDGNILLLGYDGLHVIAPNGTLLWSFRNGDTSMPESVVLDKNDNAYLRFENRTIGDDGNFVDRLYLASLGPDGGLRWVRNQDTVITAVSADGLLYGVTSDHSYSQTSVRFIALRDDGSVKWLMDELHGPSPLGGSYGGGLTGNSAIGSDGTVYFTGWNSWVGYGYVLALKGNPHGGDPGLTEQTLIVTLTVVTVAAIIVLCYIVKRRDEGEVR
jgi:hypothetical protein